jgi:hypothetical protein
MEQNILQSDSTTRRRVTPLQTGGHGFQQPAVHSSTLLNEWQIQQAAAHLQYNQDATALGIQYTGTYGVPFQTSPIDFMPATQAPVESSLPIDGSYMPLTGQVDTMPFNWHDFQNDLVGFTTSDGLPDMSLAHQNLPDNSPTDTYLEVRSLTSSVAITDGQRSSSIASRLILLIMRPKPGLSSIRARHCNRTLSESSYSDIEQQSRRSW